MRKSWWVVVASLLTAGSLYAVDPIALHRAEGPIAIDGDLGDPGWQNAARIDTFLRGCEEMHDREIAPHPAFGHLLPRERGRRSRMEASRRVG